LFGSGPEDAHPVIKGHLEEFYEKEWARIQEEGRIEWE